MHVINKMHAFRACAQYITTVVHAVRPKILHGSTWHLLFLVLNAKAADVCWSIAGVREDMLLSLGHLYICLNTYG